MKLYHFSSALRWTSSSCIGLISAGRWPASSFPLSNLVPIPCFVPVKKCLCATCPFRLINQFAYFVACPLKAETRPLRRPDPQQACPFFSQQCMNTPSVHHIVNSEPLFSSFLFCHPRANNKEQKNFGCISQLSDKRLWLVHHKKISESRSFFLVLIISPSAARVDSEWREKNLNKKNIRENKKLVIKIEKSWK